MREGNTELEKGDQGQTRERRTRVKRSERKRFVQSKHKVEKEGGAGNGKLYLEYRILNKPHITGE